MTTSPLLPLTAADLPPLAPELVLIGSAFALMILDLFVSNRNKIVTHLFSLAALAVVLFMLATGVGGQGEVFHGMFVRDTAADVMKTGIVLLSGLTLITNSLSAAACFTESPVNPDNQIIILPGVLNTALSSTSGASTILQIQTFHADIALLSPVAVNARQGAASFLHDEALIARAMSEGAAQTWILADHSKVGAASRETYCPAERIDRLFCNSQARQTEGFEALQAKVGEVVLA